MVALSAAEMDIIHDAAAPLDWRSRNDFMTAVLLALEGVPELGVGVVHRVAASYQRRFFDPPPTPRGPGTGLFDTRSSKLRDAAAIR
jgi:hypothetical protein